MVKNDQQTKTYSLVNDLFAYNDNSIKNIGYQLDYESGQETPVIKLQYGDRTAIMVSRLRAKLNHPYNIDVQDEYSYFYSDDPTTVIGDLVKEFITTSDQVIEEIKKEELITNTFNEIKNSVSEISMEELAQLLNTIKKDKK